MDAEAVADDADPEAYLDALAPAPSPAQASLTAESQDERATRLWDRRIRVAEHERTLAEKQFKRLNTLRFALAAAVITGLIVSIIVVVASFASTLSLPQAGGGVIGILGSLATGKAAVAIAKQEREAKSYLAKQSRLLVEVLEKARAAGTEPRP